MRAQSGVVHIDLLLEDPIIRLVMSADGVDRARLRASLLAVSSALIADFFDSVERHDPRVSQPSAVSICSDSSPACLAD